jgi:hypothetical protein
VTQPNEDGLELVARHGSGPLERATAIVLLARARERTNELEKWIEEQGETPS